MLQTDHWHDVFAAGGGDPVLYQQNLVLRAP
jgi:hypothetical protein